VVDLLYSSNSSHTASSLVKIYAASMTVMIVLDVIFLPRREI
jgi:hypothetical protein